MGGDYEFTPGVAAYIAENGRGAGFVAGRSEGTITLRLTTDGEYRGKALSEGDTVLVAIDDLSTREPTAAVDHVAEATTCEARAAEALANGGGYPAGSIEGVHYAEEAGAWAALALSHRTAEQTEVLRRELGEVVEGVQGDG
jgi:hypothetical protein